MRKRGRTDANQADIVKVLRKMGISVQSLSSIGDGAPDLLCGHRGKNVLLEVKDETRPPSEKRLTPDEAEWHAKWAGSVVVVESPEQALRAVLEESL